MTGIVRQGWRDLGYQLLALPASILAFALVVAGLTVTLCLAVFIVGLPVALCTFAVFRWTARLERRRAGWALRRRLPEAYRPREGRLLRRLSAVLTDPQSWKDVTWLSFAGTFGFAASTIAISVWVWVLGAITLPAWFWVLPPEADTGLIDAESLGMAFVSTAAGLAAVPVAYVLVRWMTEGELLLARLLLSPGREAALSARVEELQETRAGAVDAAAAELQRIERDLHDGAQARLVALAMDLGLAEERFGRDPDSAIELVGEAREEAKRALAELRDLARGIRPSLLAERGLGPALTALAARSPVPARVELDVPEKLPPAVELAVWFVVSEALANAGKHSGAQRALVRVTKDDGVAATGIGRVRHRGGSLVAEVIDDGRGGADPAGDGLTGLRRRVEALDGGLTVTSPAGGPTVVRAELPCGS
jgi:signal transduction histidine kinase